MKTYFFIFLSLLFANHFLIAAPSKQQQLTTLLGQLQKTYATTSSFSAKFSQKYHHRVLGRTEESKGQVRFKKPGLMRWDYQSPSEKAFIIDGKALWISQPSDKQVFVDRCFKQDGLSASVAFLWGQGNLSKEFNIIWYEGEFGDKSSDRILLTPKKTNTAFKNLMLVLDKKSHRVKQSVVIDLQGNTNQFTFDNAEFNKIANKTAFTFTPPTGVAVLPVPGSCAK